MPKRTLELKTTYPGPDEGPFYDCVLVHSVPMPPGWEPGKCFSDRKHFSCPFSERGCSASKPELCPLYSE